MRRAPPALQLALVAVTAALVGASFLGSPHRLDQTLHHLPTFVVLPLLACAARRRWLGDRAFLATILFLWVHTLGARYLYSFVPYDEWSRALLGTSVSELFGWRRNHYDRLVHLAYGFLITFPQVELLERRVARPSALVASVAFVLAVGSLYEMAEWGVALALDPLHADRYNGQQGDAWDAQKDTALAFLGALIATAGLALGGRKPAGPRGSRA